EGGDISIGLRAGPEGVGDVGLAQITDHPREQHRQHYRERRRARRVLPSGMEETQPASWLRTGRGAGGHLRRLYIGISGHWPVSASSITLSVAMKEIVLVVLTCCANSFAQHFIPAASFNAIASEFSGEQAQDRKSTRLNSSHQIISYAVFCLKNKI